MNIGRIILGGFVGGLIINVVEQVVHGIVLRDRWDEVMKKVTEHPVGTQAMVLLWIIGFVIGVALAWLYAAIRPRYGAGPKTAIVASIYLWIVSSLLWVVGLTPWNLWPRDLSLISLVVSLIEYIVAGLVAGYLYREQAAAA
jgi:uncharacterized membrane protein